MKIISHRGTHSTVENTLTAFAKLKSLGIDTVEFDVQMTADNQPVVFHDYTLWRLASSFRPISSFKWEELAKISIRQGTTSDRISHLDEVLSYFEQHKLHPIIDFKPLFATRWSLESFFNSVKRYPNSNLKISSFSDPVLFEAEKKGIQALKCVFVHHNHRVMTPLHLPKKIDHYHGLSGLIVDYGLNLQLVEFAQRHGLQVMMGTAQRPTRKKIKTWSEIGVSGILTNDTEKLFKLMD